VNALLLQTGYLTIKSIKKRKEKRLYILGCPNNEVKESFLNYLIADFTGQQVSKIDPLLIEMIESLEEKKVDQFINILQRLFSRIPAHLYMDHEFYYHSLFYMILALMGAQINVEIHHDFLPSVFHEVEIHHDFLPSVFHEVEIHHDFLSFEFHEVEKHHDFLSLEFHEVEKHHDFLSLEFHEVEKLTDKGRVDAVIEFDSLVYVIELKKGGPEAGMKQIKKKRYWEPYMQSGKEIVLLAVGGFEDKDIRCVRDGIG